MLAPPHGNPFDNILLAALPRDQFNQLLRPHLTTRPLPQGLTLDQLLTDLTLQFGVLNQFSLKSAEVLVPEPTTLALAAIGGGDDDGQQFRLA